MLRHTVLLTLLVSIVVLSACELDARRSWPFIGQQVETATPTPTHTPIPTGTPTPVDTPTPTLTPSPTPTNTPTPIPSQRLVLAQRAYNNGDYETARAEFEALLASSNADLNEQGQALHWRGRSELQLGDTAAAIATFKMFLQQYPSHELARAAQFNLGMAYEQAGQFEKAMMAYRGSIIPDDPINVYIYERIGDVGLHTRAYTDTIAAYQTGIESTDDSGFQVHLREGIAQVELLRDRPTAAIAQYEAILDVAEIETYRAKILRLAGEAYLAAGNPEMAYERYLEAVNRYPQAYDSYLALLELVKAEVPVDEFQRGLVDYHAGAYQPAIAAFDRYLNSPAVLTPTVTSSSSSLFISPVPMTATTSLTSTGPMTNTSAPAASDKPTSPSPVAEAIWLTGLSWQALGGYNSAIFTFQKLIDAHPDHPEWGQAHLEIGKALIGQDNISRAKATFRDFAAKNPEHPLAGEALWRAALLELDGDLLAEAYASLRELADTYPDDEYADDALYWAGRAAFMSEDYEAAIAAWADLARNYPDSNLASFGDYWQSKLLLTLDRDDEAEAILTQLSQHMTDYYSLRARDLLTNNQPHSVPLVLPSPIELAQEQVEAETWLAEWLDLTDPANPSALNPQIRDDPAFKRGQTLLAIGLRDEALVEFETVKENWWDDALAMYQLSVYFRDKGLGRLSIITAEQLVFLSPASTSADTPIFIQRLLYPICFEDLIFAEAEKYGLDPALVMAIIRQESRFERSAHSHAGARGLMQVMPATGEYVAERGDFGSYDSDQLWLPYLNIRFGTWYINQQLGIFDNNQFAALAAYNAGPGNVLEWIKNSDDLDTFVESIPFWESRLYIRTIYVNLAAYRRLYGAPATAANN